MVSRIHIYELSYMMMTSDNINACKYLNLFLTGKWRTVQSVPFICQLKPCYWQSSVERSRNQMYVSIGDLVFLAYFCGPAMRICCGQQIQLAASFTHVPPFDVHVRCIKTVLNAQRLHSFYMTRLCWHGGTKYSSFMIFVAPNIC